MALKEILSETRSGSWYSNPTFRQPHVRAARKLLASKFTEADSLPPIVELDDVARRLKQAVSAGTLGEASRRDWSKAGWCLWLDGHNLADIPAFLRAYVQKVRQSDRRSQYKKLIGAYLHDFDASKSSVRAIGRLLAEDVMKWDWVWAERQRKYQLFSTSGPSTVARGFLDASAPVDVFLEECGLNSNIGDSGFARAAYLSALASLGQSGGSPLAKSLSKILSWSVDESGIRYPGTEGQLAEALLIPWQNDNPAEKIQQQIEEFLLQHFKDPRVPNAPGSKWMHVSEDAKSVMLRWMVGAALEQFLQVVDQVAMPSQWKYRRAFWTAYYKAGVVDEAWVAFAPKGQLAARRSFGNVRGFAYLSGASQDHAVLIMKIGGLTIADWSHNGKCHIWTEANRSAPRLYRPEYDRYSLIKDSSNEGVVHGGARRGTWQETVALYIAKRTRIRLSRNDYMPAGRG